MKTINERRAHLRRRRVCIKELFFFNNVIKTLKEIKTFQSIIYKILLLDTKSGAKYNKKCNEQKIQMIHVHVGNRIPGKSLQFQWNS